jgi:tetratricopeptide (TPR) repeat protein
LNENVIVTRLSDRIMEAWRKILDRNGDRLTVLVSAEDELFMRARNMARAGNLVGAAASFGEAAAVTGDFFEAVEGHGEVLDMIGESEVAMSKYEAVRKVRAKSREGAPDRSFVLRRTGRFSAEIAAYTSVLKSMKGRVLPFIARGNALLAAGRPEPALIDYESALLLKPGLPEALALKGEALSMMGNYDKALELFDAAFKTHPKDPDILSGRAIAYVALGRIDQADADWRRQLALLDGPRASARACVALRLADYARALIHLDEALKKEPSDPYWQLYRLTALTRLGKPAAMAEVPVTEPWPAPLFGLYDGRLSASEVLQQADNDQRRAEAAFQLGVLALAGEGETARRWLGEVVEMANPSMIEYAAARHELARLGG